MNHMEQAIDLSRIGAKLGGPFGAVLTNGNVTAGAHNRVVKLHDPTAHAEILAIRHMCEVLGTHDLQGCTLYASCEPCPMCVGAIQWSRIDAVYYAATAFDAMEAGFDDLRFHKQMYHAPKKDFDMFWSSEHRREARKILLEWKGPWY